MIQKWITWVIPSKDLEEFDSKEIGKLQTILETEMREVIDSIGFGTPTTFKITNLSRRDEREN